MKKYSWVKSILKCEICNKNYLDFCVRTKSTKPHERGIIVKSVCGCDDKYKNIIKHNLILN